MRMVVKETQDAIPTFVQRPDFFTRLECEQLIDALKDSPQLTRGLVGDGKTNSYRASDNRICDTCELTVEEYPWLYKRFKEFVREINDVFEFDIYGIFDNIAFVRYEESKNGAFSGRFGWHQDAANDMAALRKISISVALSDSEDYCGGNLQIFDDGITDLGKLPQGSLTAFPSYQQHRVVPIVSGTRYVLVLFVLGPRFR